MYCNEINKTQMKIESSFLLLSIGLLFAAVASQMTPVSEVVDHNLVQYISEAEADEYLSAGKQFFVLYYLP